MKSFPHRISLRGWNSGATIVDLDDHFIAVLTHHRPNRSIRRRELGGVIEAVAHDLSQANGF